MSFEVSPRIHALPQLRVAQPSLAIIHEQDMTGKNAAGQGTEAALLRMTIARKIVLERSQSDRGSCSTEKAPSC